VQQTRCVVEVAEGRAPGKGRLPLEKTQRQVGLRQRQVVLRQHQEGPHPVVISQSSHLDTRAIVEKMQKPLASIPKTDLP
jgi:hypothetical protein